MRQDQESNSKNGIIYNYPQRSDRIRTIRPLRWFGHVVRIGDRDSPKWPGKLEYRERDSKEDPDRPGKKGYSRF